MRVVLASQDRNLRLALQLYLDAEPGLVVVGAVGEAASLRGLLQSSRPDLVILDWDLPGYYAPIPLLAEIKRPRPSPQIIVLDSDEGIRQEALAAGADAFVMSADLPDDLTAAIRQSRARHQAGTRAAAVLCGDTPQVETSDQILVALAIEHTWAVALVNALKQAGVDMIAHLEHLGALKAQGLLTDDEFAAAKQKLVA